MEKILISACLIGDKTRYDGKSNYHPLIKELLEEYDLVPFCPEVEGGLKVPRLPSEIKGEEVYMENNKNVTRNFFIGAEKAMLLCSYLNIHKAILKEGSPSCGKNEIYDGTFTHKKIKGKGITVRQLERLGIKIYTENEIEELLKNK